MKKSNIIAWDLVLLAIILIYIYVSMPENYSLIVGISIINIFVNCLRNHVAGYKLTGKIY